jgi:hypothetical protein
MHRRYHLVKHVAHATTKATPVRKHNNGQLLAMIEITNGLRSLVRRVGEPHKPWLLNNLLPRL